MPHPRTLAAAAAANGTQGVALEGADARAGLRLLAACGKRLPSKGQSWSACLLHDAARNPLCWPEPARCPCSPLAMRRMPAVGMRCSNRELSLRLRFFIRVQIEKGSFLTAEIWPWCVVARAHGVGQQKWKKLCAVIIRINLAKWKKDTGA